MKLLKRVVIFFIIALLIFPSLAYGMEFEEFIKSGDFGIDVTGEVRDSSIKYKGEHELTSDTTINIKFKNAMITDILSVIAMHINKNIFFIEEPIITSFEMYNVDPMVALETFLSREGLSYLERDGIIIVGEPLRLQETFFDRMSLYEVRLKHITSLEFNEYLDTLGVEIDKIVIKSNKRAMYVRGLPQQLAMIRDIQNALDKEANINSEIIMERVDLSYISPAYLTELLAGLGLEIDILQPEKGKSVIWLRGSNIEVQEAKEFISFVDDPANMEENLPMQRVDLLYITTDILIELIEQANLGLDVYTVANNSQTLWIQGPESEVRQLEEIIRQVDILQNRYITKEYEVFAYQLENVVPRDVIGSGSNPPSRIAEWGFEDVRIIGYNFPDFGNDILVITPPELKTAVIEALNAIDGNRRTIRLPIMLAEGTHPEDVLREWQYLLSDLLHDRGIRRHTFTIMPYDLLGGTGPIDEDTGIRITRRTMYAEATPDKIKLIVDMLEHLGATQELGITKIGVLSANKPPDPATDPSGGSDDENGGGSGNGPGGGSAIADNTEVSITSVEYLDKAGDITPSSGNRFVKFHVFMRNRGGGVFVGPNDFSITDNKGNSYKHHSNATNKQSNPLRNTYLTIGNTHSGNVVFEIPKDSELKEVVFDKSGRFVRVPIK